MFTATAHLVQHARVHTPVLAAHLESAQQRGRDVTFEAGPGTVGTKVIWAATDVLGKWASRVAQTTYPMQQAGSAARNPARTLSQRIDGVMSGVLKREGRVVAPKDGAQARDDLAPVGAGVTAASAAQRPYESRANAERRDVTQLVTFAGLAFNLGSMPPALRQQVEEALARNMTYYRRVSLSQGRSSSLQPLQLHALLSLATVRTQQHIRSSSGRPATVDVDALDERVMKHGEIDVEAFTQAVVHGAPDLKAAAAATAVPAGMGVLAANEPDQTHAVHRWMNQASPRYQAAIDAALDRPTDDRPAPRLVRSEQLQEAAVMSAPSPR